MDIKTQTLISPDGEYWVRFSSSGSGWVVAQLCAAAAAEGSTTLLCGEEAQEGYSEFLRAGWTVAAEPSLPEQRRWEPSEIPADPLAALEALR